MRPEEKTGIDLKHVGKADSNPAIGTGNHWKTVL